jgi:mannosidase alpha-like ER degradation enhancer 2
MMYLLILGVDSIFEYLVKGSILFNDQTLLQKWRLLEKPIETYLNTGHDFYIWASMSSGATTQKIAQSLGKSLLIFMFLRCL